MLASLYKMDACLTLLSWTPHACKGVGTSAHNYILFFDTAIFSVFLNDVILHFTAKVCLCILTGENVLTWPPTRPLAIAYYTIEPSKNDGAF